MICVKQKNFDKLLNLSLQNCENKNKNLTLNDKLNWKYTPPLICENRNLRKIKPNKEIIRRNLTDPIVPNQFLTSNHNEIIQQRIHMFVDIPIPEWFSWRQILGDKILPVRDQGDCGDCWAYSTTSTLADRYAVKYINFGLKAPELSILWTVTNTKYYKYKNVNNYSCEGGNIPDAISLFQNIGCKLEECWPMDLITGKVYPQALMTLRENCCWNCCSDSTKSNNIYKSGSANYLSNTNLFSNEEITKNIQKEILTNGPVTAHYLVFDDFYEYCDNKDKVYIRNSQNDEGWHAVEIVGWGKNSDGIRYWEVKNSWGTSFCDNGYFKIAFSIDIPSYQWCYLDIPLNSSNILRGGVYSFDTKEFCPGGYYCPNYPDKIKCPTGSYCPINSTTPQSCPFGYYCPSSGLISPILCPNGYYCDNTTIIKPCPSDKICPSGSVEPLSCPLNSIPINKTTCCYPSGTKYKLHDYSGNHNYELPYDTNINFNFKCCNSGDFKIVELDQNKYPGWSGLECP
jgi:C1A family cysteine protease